MNRQQRRAAERARHRVAVGVASAPVEPPTLQRARRSLADGQLGEAETLARRQLATDDDVRARIVLVEVLRTAGRHDEATMEARRVVTARPTEPVAHEILGRLLLEQDRVVEAVAAFERAVAIDPTRSQAHQGLGAALLDGGVLEPAAASFRRAIELAPRDPGGYASLAAVQVNMGRYADAVATMERAEIQGAGSIPGTWNRSLATLGTGDLATGWAQYESGFAAGARTPARDLPVPRWDGGDLSGRTLLTWREQGLGDELRFASCLPDVIATAGHVIVEATPRLITLLQRSFPDATIRADRQTTDLSDVDVHAPIGSLPAVVRPTLDTFPTTPGYLRADPALRARAAERLAATGEGLRVGIAWRSMNLRTSRLASFVTLDELAPLLTTPGLSVVSLQYGDVAHREQELDRFEAEHDVHVHRWDDIDYTDDIEAVAALTAELDLVIGPCTFSVLLAATLGVPTFAFHTIFPWTHGTDHDPWFPNMRLFLRDWDEDWGRQTRAMREALRGVVEAHERD